jgi:UDP-N-acetyl-2-amino-2-deoxyglucuronate dehydrogenase
MSNSKLKFAVIGVGNIGKRHVAVIDAEPNAELVAICDIDSAKCISITNLYGDIPIYTDYNKMLLDTDADIISIASPHGLHAEMSIASLEANKHVLVEKPMALNSSDCDKMILVAERMKKKLIVVKQNRFNVPIKLAKQAMAGSHLGRIYLVQCNVMWNRHDDYYKKSDWRGLKDLEGGALQTQVSHFLDLLIWWFGDLVEAKTYIETLNHDIEIEDTGVSSLKFDSGVIGTLLWTTNVYNKNYEGSITIIGEKGTIKIGGKYLNKIEYWDIQSYPLPTDIEFEDKPNNYGKYQGTSSNHDKLMNELVGFFTKGRKGVVEGQEGKKTIDAIELIYKDTFLSRN